MPHISGLKLNTHLEFVEIIVHKIKFSMLYIMAQIVNLLLIFEPDANNEPELLHRNKFAFKTFYET